MSQIEVNLLPNNERPKKQIWRYWKKIFVIAAIIAVIGLAIFSSSAVFSDESLISNLSKLDFFHQIGRLIGSRSKELKGESGDQINILIIGMGGKNHEGGTLADTIILGSFKPTTKQVAMFSIPRDLSIPAGGDNWVKINALHAYSEAKKPGQGGKALTQTLSQLLAAEIYYYVTVDFNGFERIIDEFGGVDIEVERDLIDNQYPIKGKEYIYPIENRYQTLEIKKGGRHLNGELALKYARSRHAQGIEGSDFARSKRQQKILMALKEKIFKVSTFLNPSRINSLLNAYNEHIFTNLEIWEMLRLAQLSKDIETTQIITYALSDAPDGLLYPKIINNTYVLLPEGDNFEAIKNVWQNIFSEPIKKQLTSGAQTTANNNQPTTPTTDNQPPATGSDFKNEKAAIELQNGTLINGYAGQEKIKLEQRGFNVTQAINAATHDYEQIIIYDLSGGKYPATAAELEKIYKVSATTTRPAVIDSEADFVIVLGQ